MSVVSFGDATVFQRSDGWVTAWVRDQFVMMGSRAGLYIGVTSTGGRILELLEKPLSVQELCSKIAIEYGMNAIVVRPSVVAFLQEMLEKNAISAEDSPVAS